MSWADLTPDYQDSPYMTLDMDVTCQHPVSVAAVQPINKDTDISRLIFQDNTIQQHSASEKSNRARRTMQKGSQNESYVHGSVHVVAIYVIVFLASVITE